MIGKSVRHDFQIVARRMMDRLGVQLYLTQRHENGDMNVFEIEKTERGSIMSGKRIVREKLGMGVLIDSIDGFKPFLEVPEDIFRELLSAMQRLADEEGVPRPSEDHLKGKLEATEAHLADIRKLLFEVKPTAPIYVLPKGGFNGSHRELKGERDKGNRLTEQGQ